MTERLVTERELAGLLARLDALSRRVGAVEVIERPSFALLGSGAAFPTTPPTSAVFFRTDLGMWAYYDGTQWLTVHEYVAPIVAWSVQNNAVVTDWAIRTDFAPWITRVAIITRVDTTNNGTNFWTLNIQGVNTARSASTAIVTALTSVDTVATNTSHETAPAMTPTNRSFFRLDPRTTGAPGVLTAAITIYYRLILV